MAQTDIRFTFEVTPNTSEEASEDNVLPIQLDVISFKLEEALNTPFCLEVDLISHDADIDFDTVIDQPAVFTIYQQGTPVRYVHGLISRFEMGETGFRRTRYRAVVEPSLARTRLTSDWRVFQQKTSEAILADIFKAGHIQNAEINSQLEHTTREYVIQPGILNFDFIQRLAAEEGYVYRIDSFADGHRLLLTDIIQTFGTIASHQNSTQAEQNTNNNSGAQQEQSGQNNPNIQPVIYNPNTGGDRQQPALRSFTYSQRVRTARQIQRDYTFKNPRYTLEHKAYGENLSRGPSIYERYDYGTHAKYKQDAAGKPFTQTKIQSLRNDAKIAVCIGDNAKLQPGLAFELTGHTKESLNIWWRPVRITHTGTQHTAGEEESATAGQSTRYEQTAELVPAADNWKADIPPPHQIEGPLIAHVTTPDGEELYCDEYGRVKVIFPWQREEQPNEHSSCWIRVAQNWAGAGWGHMALPRKNQEVIVEFLHGDESQPIITGRTYDQNHPTPYKLPALKTQQTTKSKEHKGEGYNELLIDDTTGEIKTQLHTTHATTQLTMGHLTHPRRNDGSGDYRGDGFELRTDTWGAIRAGHGLYISADKREKAQGSQLDIQEAIEQLETALSLAKDLANASNTAGTAQSDTGTQEYQLNEVYKELQQSGILTSSPQGIATVTPSSAQISAGKNITLTAIENTDISTLKNYTATAGDAVSILAVDKEMNLIANKGQMKIQAQHNKMHINARDDLEITSSKGKVTVAAKDELTLTCGGAYIKIKAGKIEIGGGGLDLLVGNMVTTGSSTMDYTLPGFTKAAVTPQAINLAEDKHIQEGTTRRFFLFSE
jgi:type VI secretion system secreted protein VgrG